MAISNHPQLVQAIQDWMMDRSDLADWAPDCITLAESYLNYGGNWDEHDRPLRCRQMEKVVSISPNVNGIYPLPSDYLQLKRISEGPNPLEMIVNGGFDEDIGWDKDAQWIILDGVAFINGGLFKMTISQPQNFLAGNSYKVTYTISGYQDGIVRPVMLGGIGIYGTPVSDNGTYTETLTAEANSNTLGFMAFGDDTNSFTLDNVSMQGIETETGGVHRSMSYIEPVGADIWYPNRSSGGNSHNYSIIGNSIYGLPNSGQPIELVYYAKIPPLTSSAPVNWLITANPNIYLYGSMLMAADKIKFDDEAKKYALLLRSFVSGMNESDQMGRMGRAGLSMRGPCP